MEWKVRAIRGATTASENTKKAIREVVTELLDAIETHNQLDPEDIASVIFTTTQDLDAVFRPRSLENVLTGTIFLFWTYNKCTSKEVSDTAFESSFTLIPPNPKQKCVISICAVPKHSDPTGIRW